MVLVVHFSPLGPSRLTAAKGPGETKPVTRGSSETRTSARHLLRGEGRQNVFAPCDVPPQYTTVPPQYTTVPPKGQTHEGASGTRQTNLTMSFRRRTTVGEVIWFILGADDQEICLPNR